jgi:ATP-dependent Clp protease adapter protein ClpS
MVPLPSRDLALFLSQAIMTQVFWLVFLWWFGLFAGCAAHEAGHLLCARIGSIPIRQIVIGWGPVLARGRVGKLRLEFRLWPLDGFVMPAASATLPKRRAVVLYVLGGALGNIAAIGVVTWLHVVGAAPKVLHDTGMPLIFTQMGILIEMQLFFIVTTLTPHWVKLDGRLFVSDGMQLLKLLWPGLIAAIGLHQALSPTFPPGTGLKSIEELMPDGLTTGIEILNDNTTPMEFVVTMLVRHLHLTQEHAITRMLAIHEMGGLLIPLPSMERAECVAAAITSDARRHNHCLVCRAVDARQALPADPSAVRRMG